MSVPRYPKYKDSGVEWLGEVPAHWKVISIKWLSKVQRGASPRPIDDPQYFDDDGEYAWVRIGDVSASDGILKATTQRLSALGASLSVKLDPGQMFVSIAGTVGKPCISAIKACIHDGFVYFPTLEIEPSWLYRNFEAGVCYRGLGKWGTQLNLNTDTIGSIRVALPPSSERRDIMSFIARETTKIDALVAQQRRLIELLTDKRRAVISNAVTKGLDPEVPTKPSGVEFLGDVPRHWPVVAVRRIVRTFEQGWSPECLALPAGDDSWGVVKAGCVNGGVFDARENKALPEALEPIPSLEIQAGDVLMSRASGSPDLIGSTAFVGRVRRWLMISDKIFRLHLAAGIDGQFLAIAFGSRCFRTQIERAISGADGLANNLPQSAVKSFTLAVPPLEEQEQIVRHCGEHGAEVSGLIDAAGRAISLLEERRTAQIFAAVTGKMDVRGFAAIPSNAA